MSTDRHPPSVGHDTLLERTESTDQHIPRGYAVDHCGPTAFVVRCAEHGRILVDDSRGNAHRRASQHALHCDGNAGVTPISASAEIEADAPAPLGPGDLDPRRTDLTGSDVTVAYRSVQGEANRQRRQVRVDRMLPAEDATDWRGFEATAENGVTLRVTVDGDDPAVQVVADNGRRRIGVLAGLRSTTTGADGRQPVATDGGESR